jgi:hypothetical protein
MSTVSRQNEIFRSSPGSVMLAAILLLFAVSGISSSAASAYSIYMEALILALIAAITLGGLTPAFDVRIGEKTITGIVAKHGRKFWGRRGETVPLTELARANHRTQRSLFDRIFGWWYIDLKNGDRIVVNSFQLGPFNEARLRARLLYAYRRTFDRRLLFTVYKGGQSQEKQVANSVPLPRKERDSKLVSI